MKTAFGVLPGDKDMAQTIPQRMVFYDLLRVAAIAAVVFAHSAADFLYKYGSIPLGQWQIANVIDSISRYCVPLFVIISGALVLAKECDYRAFYSKRAGKILIPLVFWSFFYMVWSVVVGRGDLSWSEAFYRMLAGKAYYHIWYIYMIFGLYLITPFIKKMINGFAGRDYKLLILIWFLLGGAFPFAGQIIRYLFSYDVGWAMPLFLVYAGYYVLGYYLANVAAGRRVWTYLAVYAAGGAATAAGTYLFTRHFGVFDEYFYGRLAPNVLIETLGIYFFLKKISTDVDWEKHRRIAKWIKTVSDLAFGIFLLHPVFLAVIMFFAKNAGLAANLAIFIPLVFAAVFLASVLAAFVMKKIPFVSRLI